MYAAEGDPGGSLHYITFIFVYNGLSEITTRSTTANDRHIPPSRHFGVTLFHLGMSVPILPAVDILNVIRKVAAVMWQLVMSLLYIYALDVRRYVS